TRVDCAKLPANSGVFQTVTAPSDPCSVPEDAGMLAPFPSQEALAATPAPIPIEPTAETLWTEVATRLRGALNDTTYRTWFAEAGGVALTDDTFTIRVANDFT